MRLCIAVMGWLVALSAGAGVSYGQAVDREATGVFEIAGRVLDADTGVPVARARVTMNLAPAGPRPSPPLPGQAVQRPVEPVLVVTDLSGEFRITNVPAGQAMLSCAHSGFIDPDPPLSSATSISLVNRKTAGAVSVTLYVRRQALLRGTALNERGTGAGGMVQAYRMTLMNGRYSPQPTGGAGVGADGAFRLAGLKPGRYVVSFAPNGFPLLPGNRVYSPVFYPGSRDVAGARELILHAGEEQQVDFRPVSEPGYEIRVRAPAAPENMSIWISPAAGPGGLSNPVATSANWDAQERVFRASRLPAGQYVVRGQWMEGTRMMLASKRVVIAGGDSGEIVLDASAASGVLPVTVTHDGPATDLYQRQTYLQLRSETGGQFGMNEGRFQQLAPGIYWLTAAGVGYIRAAHQAGRDALRDGVLVPEEGSPSPLEVVIGQASGTVEVSIDSIGGGVKADGAVKVAFLRHTGSGLQLEQQYVMPISRGAAAAANRPMQYSMKPGVYSVVAWSGAAGTEFLPYNEPAFLSRYGALMEQVTLGETGRQPVTIRHLLPAAAFEDH